MKHLMKMCMRRALVVAVVGAGISLAGASDLPGQFSASDGMLAQVMALHGLDERGAIERLAAEEAATDLYHRVQGMNIPGYAGAWFDADSQKLHVALSDMALAQMLSKFGAAPVQVAWSLAELEGLQRMIGNGETGLGSDELRELYVNPRTNRVFVGVVPGQADAVSARLSAYSDKVEVHEVPHTITLTADIRAGDGTRNKTWETLHGGIWPCTIGASVENGFYTAGHCVDAGNVLTTPAGTALGQAQLSAFPPTSSIHDVAWVKSATGWTPKPKVNGYSDGVISVPAKWAGTAAAPIGVSVCRYGQTSGGPHCGAVNALNVSSWFGTYSIVGMTEVSGACSDDGDSGGPWLTASSRQMQGSTIGASTTNTCPTPTAYTYFQPFSDHISAYANHATKPAGSLLTSHGTASPTVSAFLCPDMTQSGLGTFICHFGYYNSQGVTSVNWTSSYLSWSGDEVAYGTCTQFDTVSVKLTVTNPYGSYSQTKSFACPMGPIP